MFSIDEIGIRIRRLRKENNMTSVELAQLIRISQPYLSQIERGNQIVPVDVLIDICNVFGITPEQFFSEKEKFNDILSLNKVISVARKLDDEELEALKQFLEVITRNRERQKND